MGLVTRRKISSWLDHHDNGRDLERSMIAGCHLCTMIWHHFTDESLSGESERLAGGLGPERKRVNRVARLLAAKQIRIGFRTHGFRPAGNFELAAVTDSGSRRMFAQPIDFFPEPRPECRGPGIEQSEWYDLTRQVATVETSANSHIPLLRRWLDECEANHETCQARLEFKLPHRLIDLQGTEANDRIRLVLTADLGIKRVPYVALSYCWGSSSCFKLTSETAPALTAGISVSGLPLTIQHAISVSRNLGFRYIWVDSLCIVQDSKEDWAQESANMCDVYQGSHICVASLESTSSDQGMFAIRDPLMYAPLLLGSMENGTRLFAVPSLLAWHLRTQPLHKRAWVTQERILAPRTIGFGQYLRWECREAQWTETGWDHQPKDSDAKWKAASRSKCGRFFDDVLRTDNISSSTKSPLEIHLQWKFVLDEYTKCSLTHGTDRLAALLGIASAFQRRTGWEFTAGLWIPFFLSGLLWLPMGGPSALHGVGPSWSWTSTLEEVFTFVDSASSSKLQEHAEVIVPEESKTGCVSLGATMNKPLPIYVTCIALEVDSASGFPVQVPFKGSGQRHSIRWDRGNRIPARYFLLMAEGHWSNEHDTAYFLVIADSDSLNGAFERVGFWKQDLEKAQGPAGKVSRRPKRPLFPLASREWLDDIIATGERRTFTLV